MQNISKPFEIIKRINPVSYKLQLPSHMRIHPTFHVSLLKHFVLGPQDELSLPDLHPEPRIIDNLTAYTVHQILCSRRKAGAIEDLVDWEAYGPEEQSWVKSKDILDPLLKQVFHKTYP